MAERRDITGPVQWARLPLRFDPELLRAELGKIDPGEWIAHYNQADYAGDWSGVALRSPNGSAMQLFSSPSATSFLDTPVLERCAYFREVLSKFECPLKAVRLLRLRGGSRVLEHTDCDLKYEDGELRIHIPIETNPETEFVVAGQRLTLAPGETWYIDFSQPHRIHNRGTTCRIHLVIDGRVNQWADRIISSAERPAGVQAPPDSDFEGFRDLVFEDPALQSRLLATRGQEAFFDLTAALGRERGCTFTADDVRVAFRAANRTWIERWVEM